MDSQQAYALNTLMLLRFLANELSVEAISHFRDTAALFEYQALAAARRDREILLEFKIRGPAKPAAVSTPTVPLQIPAFPFVKLPAELRNRIYVLATKQETPVRLRHFVAPALSRVSRQLRVESLAVFFDINTFVAEVQAPYHYNSEAQEGKYLRAEDPLMKETGTLHIKTHMTRNFYKYFKGSSMRFRNVDLVLLDMSSTRGRKTPDSCKNIAKRLRLTYVLNNDDHLDAVLSIRASKTQQPPVVTLHNCVDTQALPDHRQDLEHLITPAKERLTELVTSPKYKGLSMKDLRRLANTVRVSPPNGATVYARGQLSMMRGGGIRGLV